MPGRSSRVPRHSRACGSCVGRGSRSRLASSCIDNAAPAPSVTLFWCGLTFKTPLRWTLAGALAAAAVACTGFLLLRPAVEAAMRLRLVAQARQLGLSTTLGGVRLAPSLSLELTDVVLESAGRVRLSTRRAVVSPQLSLRGLLGRAARVYAVQTVVELPAGVRLEIAPSFWLVESRPPALRVARLQPGQRLEVEATRGKDVSLVHVHAERARLSGLLRVLWHGCTVVDPGTVDGDGRIEASAAGPLRIALGGRAHSIAIASWAAAGTGGCRDAELGAATDASVEATVLAQPDAGWLRADSFRVSAGGVEAHGRLAVEGGLTDPRLDFELEVPRLDFARLLATAGLEMPADDLGSAVLSIHVSGPPLDPAALSVAQRLDFTPPARTLPSIERLKRPFVHRVETSAGQELEIRISPESPDFLALADVPPLFLRTLLIAEDANFYGHPGVDLSELPMSMATNFARGSFARGGSTISQQLAKNLFLSRRKTISRKLEEASLALLLDSALGKSRVLEVYLNVIEWGPGLYGLRPAARHYFGVEPQALTPKQMTFLVSLIPGPVKYQRSLAGGVPTPFFDGLMTTLLTRLQSVGALSETECAAAVAEPLALVSAGAGTLATP
jgi:penicillin-binding protein 1A